MPMEEKATSIPGCWFLPWIRNTFVKDKGPRSTLARKVDPQFATGYPPRNHRSREHVILSMPLNLL